MHAGSGVNGTQAIVAARFHCAPQVGVPGGTTAVSITAVGLHLAEIAAAEEAQWAVIKIIAVEFVDAHADRA